MDINKTYFIKKCHNEGHLTKECKFLLIICSICQKQRHEVNDCPSKKLGGQYVKKDIPIHVVQLETSVE